MLSRELPTGYKFVEQTSIAADEVADLWTEAKFVGWPTDSDSALQAWDEILQEGLSILGVRTSRYLVGIGAVVGNDHQAELTHLAVHPNHRHLGVAQVITKERVHIADRIGIQKLYVRLTEANTLRPLYHDLGFRALNSNNPAYLRRKAP